METTVKISTQGQINIPSKIRQLLGLKPQDRLILTADPITKNITLSRQKTIKEQLAELDRLRQASETPETIAAQKKYKGKTVREIREMWDNSPEGQKYYREKYFNGN